MPIAEGALHSPVICLPRIAPLTAQQMDHGLNLATGDVMAKMVFEMDRGRWCSLTTKTTTSGKAWLLPVTCITRADNVVSKRVNREKIDIKWLMDKRVLK